MFTHINNSGSTKNKQTYAGAYMEHKKTASVSSHNHQQYTFKKSTNNWNGNTEVSSKANRMRHGSKGNGHGPMQLDPEPMFLQNNSKLDKLEQRT